MASNKQVKNLAKNLAKLIGKLDEQVENSEKINSQEAQNKAFSDSLHKKDQENH